MDFSLIAPIALVALASLAGSSQATQQGIALRDPAALEVLAKVRSVAFDKTGTLTQGQHRVLHTMLRDGEDEEPFRQQLAVAVRQSEHPLANGLRHWANGALARHRPRSRSVSPDSSRASESNSHRQPNPILGPASGVGSGLVAGRQREYSGRSP